MFKSAIDKIVSKLQIVDNKLNNIKAIEKTVIESLAPVLGIDSTEINFDVSSIIPLVEKAKRHISREARWREKYQNAKQIIYAIQTIIKSEDPQNCISQLNSLFE